MKSFNHEFLIKMRMEIIVLIDFCLQKAYKKMNTVFTKFIPRTTKKWGPSAKQPLNLI